MQEWIHKNPTGIVIHSAAVGDYEVIGNNHGKIPSGQTELTLHLRPTPKILNHLKSWSADIQIVSFKAAPPSTTRTQMIELVEKQRLISNSNLVFGNVLSQINQDICLHSASETNWYRERTQAIQALIKWIQSRVDEAEK